MNGDPYSSIASRYDDLIGRDFFRGLRRAFEALVRAYGINFSSAADVGSGTGIFARYLCAQFRVPVFAVEPSEEMACVAMAARGRGWSGVRHLRQDMRCLRLPTRVELITANHDTVNHLECPEDVRRFFGRARLALAPGGHIVFDVITPAGLTAPGHRLRVSRTLRGGARSTSTVRRIDDSGRFETVVDITAPCRPGQRVRNVERAYPLVMILRLLTSAGLCPRGAHDATDLGPATSRSGRVIVVAVRA